MEIDIIEQKNPFIMVPKQAFQDRALTATEKGLYAMLYSVLPHRTYTIGELSIAAGLSQPATMTALSNLSIAGYLRFSRDGKIYFNGIC
jgi:DNA-binding transcriptional ArsR family regulator